MSPAAANFPNLEILSRNVLSYTSSVGVVQNSVQRFLDTETKDSWEIMSTAFTEALSVYKVGPNDSLRILLAISDGSVAYDTSKSNNTYANFLAGEINNNHNTRPEIMVAILGNTGVGISSRFSRSVNSFLKYNALRFGDSTSSNAGTFRVSLSDTLPVLML